MGKFVIGLVIGLVAVPLAVFFYFATGSAPVATSSQPMPFEKMLAHKALDARIQKEMPSNVPISADAAAYVAGAQVYRDNCAVCHGLPGQPDSSASKGMYPYPPQLFKGKGVTDDPAGETYWKVSNGIRMSGMPSFKASLSDGQMWQVSVLLANADKVPQQIKDTLTTTKPSP